MGATPANRTVGALIPRKGQARVIEALAMLPGVHYWLAGAGEEEGHYRALAQRLGVADRVHLIGPVAHADLPQLYRAANVVVMPRSEEHTSELQSLMRISYAVFCLKQKTLTQTLNYSKQQRILYT